MFASFAFATTYPNDLIAYWDFEGGSPLLSVEGNAYPLWCSANIDTSSNPVAPNGSNAFKNTGGQTNADYCTISDTDIGSVLDFAGDWSFCAWVNGDEGYTGDFESIATKREPAGSNGFQMTAYFSHTNWQGVTWYDDGNTSIVQAGAPAEDTNYFYCYTVSYTDNNSIVYIDNAVLANDDIEVTATASVPNDYNVMFFNDNTKTKGGDVTQDDMRFYDWALDAGEIDYLYNNSDGTLCDYNVNLDGCGASNVTIDLNVVDPNGTPLTEFDVDFNGGTDFDRTDVNTVVRIEDVNVGDWEITISGASGYDGNTITETVDTNAEVFTIVLSAIPYHTVTFDCRDVNTDGWLTGIEVDNNAGYSSTHSAPFDITLIRGHYDFNFVNLNYDSNTGLFVNFDSNFTQSCYMLRSSGGGPAHRSPPLEFWLFVFLLIVFVGIFAYGIKTQSPGLVLFGSILLIVLGLLLWYSGFAIVNGQIEYTVGDTVYIDYNYSTYSPANSWPAWILSWCFLGVGLVGMLSALASMARQYYERPQE